MSGDASTNRPVSAAVYRRRRLVFFGALVAIVVVIVLIVVNLAGGSPTPAPSGSEAPAATEEQDDAADAPAATPSASIDPASTPCPGTALQVAALTDADVYPDGAEPQLTLSVTNVSQTPCLLDAGTDQQQFLITSGAEQIWLSTDCAGEPEEAETVIEPGQQISSSTPLSWNRTRSFEGDCEGGAAVSPGFYNLEVTIGGVTSPEARQFELR